MPIDYGGDKLFFADSDESEELDIFYGGADENEKDENTKGMVIHHGETTDFNFTPDVKIGSEIVESFDISYVKTKDSSYKKSHGNRPNKRKPKYDLPFIKWDPTTVIDPLSFMQSYVRPIYDKLENNTAILEPRITMDQIAGSLEYTVTIDKDRLITYRMAHVIHNGQRKLFLAELHHLTHHLDSKNEEAIVFYAGSAPGNKAYMISQLFPKVKFIFIDPNEVRIYVNGYHDDHYSYPDDGIFIYMNCAADNSDYVTGKPKLMKHFKKGIVDKNILYEELDWEEDEMIDFIVNTDYRFYIFEEFMTPELAGSFRKLIEHFKDKKILFWSDIRTNHKNSKYSNNPTDSPAYVSDTDVIVNAAMNSSWLKIMTKDYDGIGFYSMLKMRVPYLEDATIQWNVFKNQMKIVKDLGMDYKKIIEESIKNKKPVLPWFKGTVYMQAWEQIRSTEHRLWSNLEELQSELKYWNVKDYESTCFYYNMVERYVRSFKNKYASRTIGMDHCCDCAIEAFILDKYKNKIDSSFDVRKMIINLSNYTNRTLKRYPHGFNFPNK